MRPQPLDFSPVLRRGVVAGAVLGALVLVVAEFLTLYTVRLPGGTAAVFSQSAGSHNSYALIPVAILAILLTFSAVRTGGRYALAALLVAGVVALLIGLLVDLSDARRTGLYRTHAGRLVPNAASSPSTGMYLETLGAVVLIVSAGAGLLFAEPVARRS